MISFQLFIFVFLRKNFFRQFEILVGKYDKITLLSFDGGG